MKMKENGSIFFPLVTFYFQKEKKNAVGTAKMISAVYGASDIARSTFCKWFNRFRRGNV